MSRKKKSPNQIEAFSAVQKLIQGFARYHVAAEDAGEALLLGAAYTGMDAGMEEADFVDASRDAWAIMLAARNKEQTVTFPERELKRERLTN